MLEIRGYANLGLKLYDEAIRDFDKAIESDPKNNAEAWNYKGITVLFSPKRNDESIECFDKATFDYGSSLHQNKSLHS